MTVSTVVAEVGERPAVGVGSAGSVPAAGPPPCAVAAGPPGSGAAPGAAPGASAAAHGGVAWGELDDAGLLGLARAAVQQAASRLLVPAGLDDGGLTATVEALHRLESVVHAEKLRRVREVESRQAFRAAGSRNTTEFLMRGLGLTRGEAAGVCETAKALAVLPETAGLLARGQIGAGQASTVARKLTELAGGPLGAPSAELAAGLDALVAGQVTGQTAGQTAGDSNGQYTGDGGQDAGDSSGQDAGGSSGQDGGLSGAGLRVPDRRQLGQAVDEWSFRQGADVLGGREARAWRQRRAYKTVLPDGSYHWQAWLDAAGSAHLDAALAPLSRPHGGEDPRSPGQRLADALVALAKDACDRGELPEVAAQRPHVILITSPQALAGGPGAEPSLLDGYGPVTPAVAAQLVCDAEVTEAIVDRNGEILDVGRTRRTPTRVQRIAVVARDRCCVGCGAPAARCEVHHVRWWSNGGGTDLGNLVLVCWSCHHAIHHDHHVITRDSATGRFTLQPPSASGAGARTGVPAGAGHRQRP